MSEPRLFTMIRNNDVTGVSGTGRVLDGVLFANGKVAVSWRGSLTSMCVYDSFEIFQKIHIDSHPTNLTEIIWLDEIAKAGDEMLKKTRNSDTIGITHAA